MTSVELVLISVYICVLLIKSCNESAEVCTTFGLGRRSRGEARLHMRCLGIASCCAHTRLLPQNYTFWPCAFAVRAFASNTCSLTFSEGVYIFFVVFGLVMLFLHLIIGILRLWIEGNLPKVLLLAQAHSMRPSQIMRRVVARRSDGALKAERTTTVICLLASSFRHRHIVERVCGRRLPCRLAGFRISSTQPPTCCACTLCGPFC